MDTLIQRVEYDTAELVAAHPPQWKDKNKKLVYEIACPIGSSHSGTLTY